MNSPLSVSRVICIFAPIVLVGTYFQLKSEAPKQAIPSRSDQVGIPSGIQNLRTQIEEHSIRQALPFVQQTERQREFADRVKSALQSTEGNFFDELVTYAADMPEEYIGVLTTVLTSFFSEDDLAAQEWLYAFTSALAGLNAQERALDITSYLQAQNKVSDVERRILYDWSAESWDQVFALYDRWAKEDGFVDGRQASILTSLNFNEREEHAEAFIDWVSNMDDPAQYKLQAALIEKMAMQANREDKRFQETLKLFEEKITQNPRLAEKLPALALNHSPADPKQALAWIASIDTNDSEMRTQAFAQVMQEMVLNDVDHAAELLSSDGFLINYYASTTHQSPHDENGEIRPEARKFYDTTLEAFMKGILSVDPHIVLDSVDSFFSDKLREDFRKRASDYLAESSDS